MNHDLTDEDGRVAAAQAAGRNTARHDALGGYTEPRNWEKDGNPVAGTYSHLAAAGFSRIGARMFAITFRDAYVQGFYETRLEYLRSQIEAEQISTAELIELQGLADRIDRGDNLLLEWAGVPEFPEDDEQQAKTGVTGNERQQTIDMIAEVLWNADGAPAMNDEDYAAKYKADAEVQYREYEQGKASAWWRE